MVMRKFPGSSKSKFRVTCKSVYFLLTLIVLLAGLSARYLPAQTSASTNQDIEDIIKDKKMKRLQKKILRLEKRVTKKPDDIIAREEIIRLRKNYFKKFDDCLSKLEKLPVDKISNKQRCEIKIKLLTEQKDCAFNIKEDYSQLTDGMIKYLEDLRKRALKGSMGFEGNIRYMKQYDIERIIYEMVKDDRVYNMVKITKEIEQEKERYTKLNKDFIQKYQDEVIKLETLILRAKDDCMESTE